VLHEAAARPAGAAGPITTGARADDDNGNHLLLSGNCDARAFLAAIGAEDQLAGPAQADFAFFDLATRKRSALRPNDGPLPWWIFSGSRRVPDTRPRDYLHLLRLLVPGKDAPISTLMRCDGLLYERLWRPFFLAALNTEPAKAHLNLPPPWCGKPSPREGAPAVLWLPAKACRRPSSIRPVAYLVQRGAKIHFEHRACAPLLLPRAAPPPSISALRCCRSTRRTHSSLRCHPQPRRALYRAANTENHERNRQCAF